MALRHSATPNMSQVRNIIYYLPAWYLASLCTCMLCLTEIQVAKRGSGTSNQTATGMTLMRFRPGSSFLRTLLMLDQLDPNHTRHSRMIPYHWSRPVRWNQKRCSSWVVFLSGSDCVDIIIIMLIRDLRSDTVYHLLSPCRPSGLLPTAVAMINRLRLGFGAAFSAASRARWCHILGALTCPATARLSRGPSCKGSYHAHSLHLYFSTNKTARRRFLANKVGASLARSVGIVVCWSRPPRPGSRAQRSQRWVSRSKVAQGATGTACALLI